MINRRFAPTLGSKKHKFKVYHWSSKLRPHKHRNTVTFLVVWGYFAPDIMLNGKISGHEAAIFFQTTGYRPKTFMFLFSSFRDTGIS